MKRVLVLVLSSVFAMVHAAWAAPPPGEVSLAIKEAQAGMLAELPFAEQRDFEDARRGFIGMMDDPVIKDAAGRVIYTLSP